MCVLAFAWRLDPRWPLVLAGNRDELHARPAEPLHRWSEAPHVLGGKDLASGGCWLGVSEQGRLAVVTNLRGYGPPGEGRPSRGLLVSELLTGEGEFAHPQAADLRRFNPMNLIAVDGAQARFWANRPEVLRRDLAPGLYGLSNGDLDEPWPKTRRLKQALEDWIGGGAQDLEAMFAALADESRPDDGELPSTGLELERERLASAIFIRNPVYGTRCSTIVRVGADGRGEIAERRFEPSGRASGYNRQSFSWPTATAGTDRRTHA
jgi:uncharacterized protein with NRDE domain